MRRAHRIAPRRLDTATDQALDDLVPAGDLGVVQAAWRDAVGAEVAGQGRPVALRDGTLLVACREAVWAHELALLAPDLVHRLTARLPGCGVHTIRTRVGG